jgi:hypothetical protein
MHHTLRTPEDHLKSSESGKGKSVARAKDIEKMGSSGGSITSALKI